MDRLFRGRIVAMSRQAANTKYYSNPNQQQNFYRNPTTLTQFQTHTARILIDHLLHALHIARHISVDIAHTRTNTEVFARLPECRVRCRGEYGFRFIDSLEVTVYTNENGIL